MRGIAIEPGFATEGFQEREFVIVRGFAPELLHTSDRNRAILRKKYFLREIVSGRGFASV